MRRVRRCGWSAPLWGLVAAVMLVATARAQQEGAAPPSDLPPVTFHTEVTFVEVDVFVTDADGRPVTDLTRDDFELLEDGAPQAIQSFSSVNLPIEARERPLYAERPLQPDVRSNVGTDGRIYLILLDDIHVHPTRVPRVRSALHQFIARNFGANDLAAVLHVRGNSGASQDFTNDPDLLLRAIDRFTGNVPREAPPESSAGGPAGASTAELEIAHDARNVASRVRELAEFLGSVRGRRKTILFVSEGSPFDVHAVTGQMGGVASIVIEDTQKAIAAATRGNVTIYTIDPRGLMATDPTVLSDAAPASSSGIRLAQDNLRELAYETGGFPSVNRNDLEGAFERIVRENSTYYLLGYTPTHDAQDGSYRRLTVRVKRPGLQVRSRHGYTAARAPTSGGGRAAPRSAAAAALSSPFPSGEIPLSVFAAPFRGKGRDAVVAVALEVDASKLVFLEQDGAFREHVEVLHSITDARGEARPPLRHDLALALEAGTYARVQSRGIRILLQTALPPGRYQLRTAAGSRTSGQAGGVLYDLEVPDFTRRGLSMSGLALTSSDATDAVTVADQGLAAFLPAPVTTSRTFDAAATVAVFGEVYENVRSAPVHTVAITTELRTDTGRVVRSATDTRSSSELRDGTGGYGFLSPLPLDGLDPGVYVIHVAARSSLGPDATVSRDVLIRVR